MSRSANSFRFAYMAAETPALEAAVRGGEEYSGIEGAVYAYLLDGALYIQTEFSGLPPDGVFGLQVHDGVICGSPGGEDPFAASGGHLSDCPEGTWCAEHPYHQGELPPIFSDSGGYAAGSIYLGKAGISDYSGKPLVLRSMADDFSVQPAGDSGKRIACGIFTQVL